MNELDIIDPADMGTEFFAPSTTGAVDLLLAQHDGLRRQIGEIAGFMEDKLDGGAIDYFLEGNRSEERGRRSLEMSARQLFDEAGAAKALDAAFWSKALGLTDVLDAMPQKRRSEWHEAIRTHQVPDFEPETVRSTLAALLADRSKFFAERVDGIFRGLSGEHVTNSPAAFGKRMIVARMITSYDTIDHERAGLINDLRAVIAKFMGRDEPHHSSTQPVIQRLRGQWGEWVPLDGGALRIRLYKKGTAHLEVHPDMAWRLNQVLASIYPLAIPPEFRTKPKRRVREFELIRRPLPFQVVDALASMDEAKRRVPEAERNGWRDEGWRRIPNTRQFKYGARKDGLQEAEQVLASIGGVKQPEGYWLFDYEPSDVLSEIVVTGCLPDQKAHQFYPTPGWLAEKLVDAACIGDADTVLEPSAGMGGLADLLPKDRTACVEISPLHCKILEAKGHRVKQADFLALHTNRELYDRVVMNPPFSEGRWQAHLQHAASMLRTGGRLAAILPSSAKAKAADLLPGMDIEWHGQFDDAFPGASVSVVMMTAAMPPF
jgi:hypothetical protein